jgi:hypothetical protein
MEHWDTRRRGWRVEPYACWSSCLEELPIWLKGLDKFNMGGFQDVVAAGRYLMAYYAKTGHSCAPNRLTLQITLLYRCLMAYYAKTGHSCPPNRLTLQITLLYRWNGRVSYHLQTDMITFSERGLQLMNQDWTPFTTPHTTSKIICPLDITYNGREGGHVMKQNVSSSANGKVFSKAETPPHTPSLFFHLCL